MKWASPPAMALIGTAALPLRAARPLPGLATPSWPEPLPATQTDGELSPKGVAEILGGACEQIANRVEALFRA